MENKLSVVTTNVPSDNQFDSPHYENSFTAHAKAANTVNAYLSDWEDFCLWCNQNNCRYLPADPKKVADYLEDRATNTWWGISGQNRQMKEKRPLKWSSLLRRLTTISKMHHYQGMPFKRKHPAIEKTLSGIKRVFSEKQPHRIVEIRKDPLCIEEIRAMVESLPNTLTGMRDRALLLIGFSGAFRRSEIVKICIEDLTFCKEGILVFLPWSKTGSRKVPIPYGSSHATCPVRALQEWIQASCITQGAVFRAINKHGHIRATGLSDKSVVLIIKRNDYLKRMLIDALDLKKMDPTISVPNYGGHSLRAGFVTTAILNGVPEYSIMKQTDHKKSDTVKKYIRETLKWKDNAATKLGL